MAEESAVSLSDSVEIAGEVVAVEALLESDAGHGLGDPAVDPLLERAGDDVAGRGELAIALAAATPGV